MRMNYLGKFKAFGLIFDEYSKYRPDIEGYRVINIIPTLQSELAEKFGGMLGTNSFVADYNRNETPITKDIDLWLVSDGFPLPNEQELCAITVDGFRDGMIKWLNESEASMTQEDTYRNRKALDYLLNSTIIENETYSKSAAEQIDMKCLSVWVQTWTNTYLSLMNRVVCDVLWHRREDFVLSAAEVYLGSGDEFTNKDRYYRYVRLIHNSLYANSITANVTECDDRYTADCPEIQLSNVYMLKELLNYAVVIKYLKTLSEPVEFNYFLREFVERYNAMNPDLKPLNVLSFTTIRKLLKSRRKPQI